MKFFIVNFSDIGKVPQLSNEYSGAHYECRALAVIRTDNSDSFQSIRNSFDEWVKENTNGGAYAIVDCNGEFLTR